MSSQAIYHPGKPRQAPGPLARFLPPLPQGSATQWLRAHFPSNHPSSETHWILDPFGISPDLILEIARGGYPILATVNNPILRFALEFVSNLPNEAEMRTSLAKLAAVRKGSDRLEPHIRRLYLTACDQCGNQVEAEAFLWERRKVGQSDQEMIEPFARIYQCPFCGNGGEYPITRSDLELLDQFSQHGLHYSRALEKVTTLDDPDRPYVEEALEVYQPRAVYALFTLLNKLDGLNLGSQHIRNLQALLLSAFDDSNSLWHHPTPRPRPLQLKAPSRFRENNVWIALEKAIHRWVHGYQDFSPIPLVAWPEKPTKDGGICLYEGRLKNFIQTHGLETEFGAIVTALPRPNQAFWTLSALWSGWLWGPEAVTPFKSALRRRRYDWNWHSSALRYTFDQLEATLRPNTPILALTGEAETGLISAALVGSNYAGIELQGCALRVEKASSQFTWQSPSKNKIESPKTHINNAPKHSREIRQSALDAVREFLVQCGEPKSYLHLHTAALEAIIREYSLQDMHQSPAEVLNHLNSIFERLFLDPNVFVRYGGSDKSLEVGLWWLREFADRLASKDGKMIPPLSDRVENTLVDHLGNAPGLTSMEIDETICWSFPGLLTPNSDLVSICLDSYAYQPSPQNDQWLLRPEDHADSRQRDIQDMQVGLNSLGERFEFTVRGANPLAWYDDQGEMQYVFYITTSAILSEFLFSNQHPPQRSFIVLPGGRANLAVFKQRQNPLVRSRVNQGWRFIKYRQLRWLVENPVLNLNILMEKFTLDELTYESPQIQLF